MLLHLQVCNQRHILKAVEQAQRLLAVKDEFYTMLATACEDQRIDTSLLMHGDIPADRPMDEYLLQQLVDGIY